MSCFGLIEENLELSHIHLAVMEHFCEICIHERLHANYLAHGIQQQILKIWILNSHNFFRKICFLFWSGQVFFKLKKQVANQGSRRYIYNYFAFMLKIGFHHIKIINKFCKKKIWLLKVSKSRKQFMLSQNQTEFLYRKMLRIVIFCSFF